MIPVYSMFVQVNLIDSMGVEVVVTDHAIDDVVPRDVKTYREAVKQALAEAEDRR